MTKSWQWSAGHLEPHKKVIIKRELVDLALIHVTTRNRIISSFPAIDQDYSKGLTLYQHTVISRYVASD